MGKPVAAISGAAMALLERYDWPGNIRELENVIERAVALERTPTILVESLPAQIRATMASGPVAVAEDDAPALPDRAGSISSATSRTSSAGISRKRWNVPAACRCGQRNSSE